MEICLFFPIIFPRVGSQFVEGRDMADRLAGGSASSKQDSKSPARKHMHARVGPNETTGHDSVALVGLVGLVGLSHVVASGWLLCAVHVCRRTWLPARSLRSLRWMDGTSIATLSKRRKCACVCTCTCTRLGLRRRGLPTNLDLPWSAASSDGARRPLV